jgi:hypothetical protein
MYDIFYLDNETESSTLQFKKLKARLPFLKRIKAFDSFYNAYLSAKQKSLTDMFWIIWPDLDVSDTFDFSYEVETWDSGYAHIFKNGKFYDGVCLLPKQESYSKREIDYRFFVSKKEIDIVASKPQPFDIVFISYNEPFADLHFEKLKNKVDRSVLRVNGIKGIHNAHIEAARLVKTNMFWVVDADAEVLEDFNFDHQVSKNNQDTVIVWKSKNPVNGLEYGNGGVKLLPRELTLKVDVNSPDMTTSISHKFRAMESVSNLNIFNTTEFTTWRSAFRECVKLASKTIRGQVDKETAQRLEVWCTVGSDKQFGEWSIKGAIDGRSYGEQYREDAEALKKINDFDWLYERFSKNPV